MRNDEKRVAYGDWGRYSCRIVTKVAWWTKELRWRYVVDETFAGITKYGVEKGRWEKAKVVAQANGHLRLDALEHRNVPGEHLAWGSGDA